MAQRSILGLFKEVDGAAAAVEAVKKAGIAPKNVDVLTGTPYPHGTFGEHVAPHRLFIFPLFGAICGLSVAILLTAGTQLAYPVVTGGKPILSIPPMFIISYEGTLLGAILFTVLGVIFESRLPRLRLGAYDPRITDGYIGVVVTCPEEEAGTVEGELRKAGAVDLKRG